MKKIFFSLVALAALAACTKSEIQYEQNADAIGFQLVSGKMTKAAVVTNTYPENLNMYVFAMTENSGAANTTADYLDNAEFAKVQTTEGVNLWGGWDSSSGVESPYYWPNVKNLYFAGISKSGNINKGATPTYSNGVISVNGYVSSPGTETLGDNDLMWFPTTGISYGKLKGNNAKVPVEMLHACSWITVKMGGDSQYTITDIHIEGLTTKANVTLSGKSAVWTPFTAADPENPTAEETPYLNQNYSIFTGFRPLAATATAEGFEDIENNTIVIPNQIPGTLSITYTFESQAEENIEETVTGSLKFDGNNPWAPGVHYVYTVTITASKILIAPTASTWTNSPASGGHDVTVQ